MKYTVIKHGCDQVTAGLLLLVVSPIVGAVLLFIKVATQEYPIFAQERVGQHERIFTLYKIRTMYPPEVLARLSWLPVFCRALRQYSVDEIPQLWNVLKGDMSLIGPRPLLVEYLPLYNQTQRKRHRVKPGITGWAQVHGRNSLDWSQRFTLDVWYVDHVSLQLDVEIILRTLVHLLHPQGVRPEGLSNEERFRGNLTNSPCSVDATPSIE
ncbi:MAG: sugar transferase [Bacteroidota bacterium]